MSVNVESLHQEKIYFPIFCGALWVASLTGFITYWYPTDSIWQQWTYLFHLFVGLVLFFIFIIYLYHHLKRSLRLRKITISMVGLVTGGFFLIFSLTGLYIGILGQRESERWIINTHILSSIAALFFLFIHILGYFLFKNRNKRTRVVTSSTIETHRIFQVTLFSTLASCLIILILSFVYSVLPSVYQDDSVIKPYEYTYGKHPFRPSETETSTGSFLDEKRVGGSEKCGSCHQQITRQWEDSIHAQAASDPTYQTNIKLLAQKKGMASTRYCEGCHAPTALLSGVLSKGGSLETKGHLFEGVGCMGCHGIDKVEHTKGVGSYHFKPAKDYLFAHQDNIFLTKIHNLLIQVQPRLHRMEMSRAVLSDPKLCATCHSQFMDKNLNNWGWIQMMDDYTAWLKSPFSQQSDKTFANAKPTRCQDCHFPLILGEDPSANKQGKIISHRSLGANTAIPYIMGRKIQLNKTIKFLQKNKINITIEKPNRINAIQNKKSVNSNHIPNSETISYFYLGEDINLQISVTNTQVGHNFPGGSIDINQAWVHLTVVDSHNKPIYESGGLEKDNTVDPKAHFYRSVLIDRYGKTVWKHDLFNQVGDSYKKIIPAGETDVINYNFTLPSWVKPPIIVTATVRYRKFNQRYAEWALKSSAVKLPIVDMATDSISIPVKINNLNSK
ncbi:MAG: hypothetical protein KAU26_06070 [Methylococcales bacterium]|nr:hypothetical protein [Methylococcales bacterium]